MSRPENVNSWNTWDFDNLKFIINELFLYAVAIFIKYERFTALNHLLIQQYYVGVKLDYGRNTMVGYQVFREFVESLEHRNNRLELRRLSLHADLLKQRSKQSGVEFNYLIQADFILFMRSEIQHNEFYSRWLPNTSVYINRFYGALEIFARASSKTYFDKMKCILLIDQPSDLEELIQEYKTNIQRLPKWGYESCNPATLLGYEQLATKP
ncbi:MULTISPECIES: hypothetical protein [Xenorhabdus]|uniref:hypothetical protein n=1 Tax=Xenorhabdus TaxID=626 RepID=UPI00069BF0D4|nr:MULTISPECIES: hypothetical protein [Xenorhabdus]